MTSQLIIQAWPEPRWWQWRYRRRWEATPQWARRTVICPPEQRCIRSTDLSGWPRCGRCAGCMAASAAVDQEQTREDA